MFLKRELLVFLFSFSLTLLIADGIAAQRVAEGLVRSDVLRDASKPGIVSCVSSSSRLDEIEILLTNNYKWSLQFPVERSGKHDGTKKLSNGREVSILAA